MIRAMQVNSATSAVELTGADALSSHNEADFLWVDVQAFDDSELFAVQQRFALHPLAIENCTGKKRSPKLTEYEGILFMVFYSMTSAAGARTPKFEEVCMFLGERLLITVHREPVSAIDRAWKQAIADPVRTRQGPDYLCYTIIDFLMDTVFIVLDYLSESLLAVENGIVTRSDGTELSRLLSLKRALVSVRRILSAERDMLGVLARRNNPLISERNIVYFRDSYDHLVRAYEHIDLERDLLGNAMDAYLSTVSNRLGAIMKSLTILSAIFLPPTFITSFFGQNFTALPFDSHRLFFVETTTCIMVPLIMLYWFYRSGWMRRV